MLTGHLQGKTNFISLSYNLYYDKYNILKETGN